MRSSFDNERWNSTFINTLLSLTPSQEFRGHFHTFWTEKGHRLRSVINDDYTLAKLLWHLLPKYEGDKVTLYRGENIGRLSNNKVGFCWTPSQETATMFASGLNAIETGGVLLSIECRPEWIISSPSQHSIYLGENEYTIDPARIDRFDRIKEYEPSHIEQ